MTPLDALHATQHDTVPTTSDAQLRAYLAGCHPANVALDRAAGMSPVELRMLGATRAAA